MVDAAARLAVPLKPSVLIVDDVPRNIRVLVNILWEKDRLTRKQEHFLTAVKKSIDRIQTFLKEMNDSTSIRFEDYLESRKMVVFERNIEKA